MKIYCKKGYQIHNQLGINHLCNDNQLGKNFYKLKFDKEILYNRFDVQQ